MKVKIFLCTCLILLGLTGCDNDTVLDPNMSKQNELSIIAPNGEKIAESMETLQARTAMNIAEQFGDDYGFTITSIEYTPLDEGYLALVNYQLENGTTSNYAVSNNMEVLTNSLVDVITYSSSNAPLQYGENGEVSITFTKSTSAANSISFKCKSASNCKPCQVKIVTGNTEEGSFVTGEGKTTISCSDTCPDCKLEATI